MQKRKFDELISYFNRKVSDMSIDQKYKMELLGMISAIGFAHEKELSTNSAEVGTGCSEFPNNSDTISRQAAIEALRTMQTYKLFAGDDMLLIDQAGAQTELMLLPPIQPKRGKWIDKGVYTYVDDHRHLFKCDQCGNGWLDTPDFCPNCGVKMEVNHESN